MRSHSLSSHYPDTNNQHLFATEASGHMTNSHCGHLARSLLIAGSVLACRPAESAPPFLRVDATDVVSLQLTPIGRISLATHADSTPEQISQVVRVSDTYWVLDTRKRRIELFDHAGKRSASIQASDVDTAGLIDPRRFAIARDTLFVLDGAYLDRIAKFDQTGRALAYQRIRNSDVLTDIVVRNGTTYAATALSSANTGQGMVRQFQNQTEERTISGCPRDPRFVESRDKGGILKVFSFVTLSVLGDKLYCAQRITPVVESMSLDGTPAGQVAFAPPFYVAPQDRKMTTNIRTLNAYAATWTALQQFHPLRAGFVQVYAVFDSVAGTQRHRLFACDTSGVRLRCGESMSPGRPVYFGAPDTLIVHVTDSTSGRAQLALYRLAF